MRAWGIVVAAGEGRRFGKAKHATLIGGRPAWQHGRDALLQGGCEAVVVVGDVPGGVPGGARRQDSVARGLDQVPADVDVVLVHDAARPGASIDLVARIMARLERGDVAGVVPGIPVTDTIKVVDGEFVVSTPTRSSLVAVQTPQGFRTGALRDAHRHRGDVTDDAELVERIGGQVAVVMGEEHNLKITVPGDVARLERALGLRP